ncbi:MAG: sulfotransferase domain-containing protein [bacterium]|nr:sulfotransferase domain-containing protein [bacterium]
MSQDVPERLHVYQNHTIDSTRWGGYVPRDDDIVIATPYKCGTTWMQHIVHNLIFMCEEGISPGDRSPWIGFRPAPLEPVMERLEEQTHRRFIKSHLPLDGIPYFPQVKYIVVSRDVRDVFMSLWNHYSGYTQKAYEKCNDTPGRVGDVIPVCPKEIRDFWKLWITKGWFEWETEGYPFWSNMRHVQTWWNFRHLPNILFVHYNRLKENLGDEILRIAAYLEMDLPEGKLEEVMAAVSFDTVKQDAIAREEERVKDRSELTFKEGARTFFYKGTNGRWKDVLTEEDLALYEAAAQRELSLECRRWLECGELG